MKYSNEWRRELESKLDDLLRDPNFPTSRTLQIRFNDSKSGLQRAHLPIPIGSAANDPNLKRLLLDGLAENILGNFDPADTQILALDWR
jgi:hypothetical protein